MGKKSKNQRTLVVPSFESYAEDRARAVADSAANVILQQTLPDVPKVPAYRFDGDFPQSAIGLLSNIEGRLGVSDATRIDMHGYEPNPETCLFTSTSKYGDSGARATSNKLFKDNPGKYGFVGIPMGEIQRGDLLQFSEGDTPKHSAIITGENEDMIPLVSYSRGGTGATTITPEGELPTMAHNVNIGKPINDIGPASAYRYTGSPEKRKEWASEYYDKYNPKEVYPNLPVYNLKELEFKPVFNYSEGGFLAPRDAWDRLSMREQAEMMKVAVKNGIYDLATIRQKYNEFAEGGDTNWSYENWKAQIGRHLGINIDEDNTYDYEGYFRKYPEEAWKMLSGNPDAHFTDEFKTVYHPTFSAASPNNDGSIYSGVKHPIYNPQGLKGGTWSPDYSTFTMSNDGYRGPVNMDDRAWYLMNNENNGVILRESDGTLPLFDNIPWAGVLPNITITGHKHSIGGPLVEAAMNKYKSGGGIHIAPSKKGTFTAAASKHGMGVQEFASKVLAHKENYSPAMVKKANFARNAKKFKHSFGGPLVENFFYTQNENLYGFGDWLKKGWNWLKNSAQVAAIAESPAVMTAAGHRITREGKAVQDKYNAPSVRQLRGNLASLGEGALGAITATGDAEAIYNVVRHPVQTARGLKSAINSGMKAVKNLSPLEKHNIKNYSSTSHFVPELDAQYIGQSLFDAKAYKTSDGYKDLVKRAIKESEEMGTGFFPEETFILPNDKVPHITFSKRPKGDLAGYKPSTNTIDIDLVQSRGKEVPFHEGLHWQKVGEENLNIGPKHDAWWKSVQDKEPTEIQDQLFYEFFNSSEFPKAQYRRNANEYLLTKTKQAVKEDTPINSEIRKPYELNAHSIEAGRAIGIEPFSPYPGYIEASKEIKKAIKYDKSLKHIKHDNRAEVENFWNLLTGNYMPVVLGGITLTPQLTEE